MNNQELLYNINFRNNQNYIIDKREEDNVFVLTKLFTSEESIEQMFDKTTAIFLYSFMASIIISLCLFVFISNIFDIKNYNFMYFVIIVYLYVTYILYEKFVTKGRAKRNWIKVLKKTKKRINLEKYINANFITKSLKKEVFEWIEKHYILLKISDKNDYIKTKDDDYSFLELNYLED